MDLESQQLLASFVAIFVAASVASLLVFERSRRTATRKWGTLLLCLCGALAVSSWTRFGQLHDLFIDAPDAVAGQPQRPKIKKQLPIHFHEFFHYYIGAKYFGSLGYEGLYGCTALADKENALAGGVPPHIAEWVRDLDDVLRDVPYETALVRCRDDYVAHMPPARWEGFKADIRELQRLVPDEWWKDAVNDAGFNPPPSWILLGGALANTIPIRLFGAPTYLLATSLDVALIIACFLVLSRSFGTAAAATVAVYFGASFIASYQWNGGGFLRYTWIAALVFGLAAARQGRWVLAGALLGYSTCDRLFPGAFAVGAVLPLAWRALRSQSDRVRLKRFGTGFGAMVAALVLTSMLVFGVDAWRVFFSRILRHGDVYYTMHIGLKKVITFRDWVPARNFRGHEGLQLFRDWNGWLRQTWAQMRWLAVPVQLLVAGGAALASVKRRPYEAALLFGITAMFCFSLPANYYYVVLALVPGMLMRSAMTSPTPERRMREWAVLSAFTLFWICTLLAPHLYSDDIVYDHFICVLLLAFLSLWIVAWVPWGQVLAVVRSRAHAPPLTAKP